MQFVHNWSHLPRVAIELLKDEHHSSLCGAVEIRLRFTKQEVVVGICFNLGKEAIRRKTEKTLTLCFISASIMRYFSAREIFGAR